MNEELKELITLLDGEVGDLKMKLEAIDKLLGAPYAKDFSEDVIESMVNDVIKFNMMRMDIMQFVTRRVHTEIRSAAMELFLHSTFRQIIGQDKPE
jgi:hypothetical protein